MKVKALFGIAAALLALFAVSASAADGVNIIVDGNVVEFYEQPFIMDGCTMVPYNTMAAPLRLDIVWDKVNQSASVCYEGYKNIVCTMDRATGHLDRDDGSSVLLDAAPTVVEGRAFIPLRALCETVGYDIDWNGDTRTVEITTHEYYEQEFDLKNDSLFSILGDRLTIMLDECSKASTDYFVDSVCYVSRAGNAAVEIEPYELYRLSVGDIVKDAENLGYKPFGGSFVAADGIEILCVERKDELNYHIPHGKYGCSEQYLLRSDDNYLAEIKVSLTADSMHNYELEQKWVSSALASLSNGDKKLDTSAKTYDLNGLKINVPDGYIVTHTYEPEGEAWSIIRPETSDKSKDTIAYIGLGYHGCVDGEVTKNPNGRFLGLPVDWYEWNYENYEIATDLSCEDDVEFYVQIYAPDDKIKKELVAICESIEGDPYALSERYVRKGK
ncbi:MAG: copper amine oxidase N-terminal domain-containing protein [Clostridia bacterium]|nr:copper amine oxidase N-terminal domain-containing protein [Clostridia bacterium]